MAQNFFTRFPKIQYNIDGDGTFLTLTNIVNNVNVNSLYANESTYYTFYEILDGERPDTVSYNLYGNPGYHWTLFIINNELRNGLSDAWPMSNQQFERMLVNEYDPYIAISFLPASDTRNGVGASGLFNLLDLSSEYLPFLRLVNAGATEKASILKYDNDTMQLVVSDVRKTSDNSVVLSTESFVNEPSFYRISWDNPYEEETDEYASCELLRQEFISRHIEIFSEFDPSAIVNPDNVGGDTQEEIDAGILAIESAYVFSKEYVPAPAVFRWDNYRNAAAIYYAEDADGIKLSRTAYDVLSDESIVNPTFISNYEKEELINDQKRKIKVIRPDRIIDFVNEYFTVLNG